VRLQRKLVMLSFTVIAVFSICFAFVSPASAQYRDHTVKVMTRNMYPGADLDAIAQAGNPAELEAAIQATIESIIQSKVPERAALVAAEIAQNTPDLVALQEATKWRINSPRGTIVLDQLDLLLDSLRAMGQNYRVAVNQKLTDVHLRGVISYTDHDVILVRSGTPLHVVGAENHLYDALMSFPTLGGEITVLRGWIAVDVKIRDFRFKFVDTHLEAPLFGIPETQYLQVLQAMQLMQDLSASGLPVILAGDFNSNAEPYPPGYPPDQTESYMLISASGYTDPWHQFHAGADHGYSWPLFLTEPVNIADYLERIDFVFSNAFEAASIERIGADPVDGLFASDHAGMVAVFNLGGPVN
jgi:endonuclease/exonuclease/phosphatase family metal-dependent hydrolase